MRRDFEEYFTQVQLTYNELNKVLEKVNKEIEEGLVGDKQRESFETYYNVVKTNYDRLAYARYLLHLPPKFIQKIQFKKLQKEQEKFINSHSDKESVVSENKEAIKHMNDDLAKYEERTD